MANKQRYVHFTIDDRIVHGVGHHHQEDDFVDLLYVVKQGDNWIIVGHQEIHVHWHPTNSEYDNHGDYRK